MGTRFPGIPGSPPPRGGIIGIVVPPPSGGCTCKDVTLHWAVPDDETPTSTASTTSCPAVFSADGTICPSTEWSFDISWDGDAAQVPTIVQIGAAAWKVVATAAGTFTVIATMRCGSVTAAMPKLTNVVSAGGGGGSAWANLKDIATVTANPDMHGEGSAYDAGTGIYSMTHGTGDYEDYGTFQVEIDDADLPICCRIIALSGSIVAPNMATFTFQGNHNWHGAGVNLSSDEALTENVAMPFSIYPGDSPARFWFAFQHGGDYTPTTYRIDYIPASE